MLGPSGHADTFTRDRLPPADQWPHIDLDGFNYPEWLNCAVELTDRMVERGFGDHIALIGNGRRRTYKELTDWSNRLAHALVEDYGLKVVLPTVIGAVAVAVVLVAEREASSLQVVVGSERLMYSMDTDGSNNGIGEIEKERRRATLLGIGETDSKFKI